MQLKTTVGTAFTLVEILADNGQPANAQNPIARSEYSTVEFPEATGSLLVVSGMPMSAAAMVVLHYKNLFKAIAIANPREGVAEICHSITPDYQVGGAVPLA
jgi:hypothetical protein